MPFTVSHTAVVLPFARLLVRWRLLSAVVIGAMVPDFRVFIPWRVGRVETHSAISLVTFCLPVGLVTYWLFQRLIKTPIFETLPDGPYARWRTFSSPASMASPGQWVLAALGVLGGAITHLVWDAFTHTGARGVRMIPLLDDPILDIGRHHLVAFRLMQDLSSLVGLAAVFMMVWYGLRRGTEVPVPRRPLAPRERQAWMLAYVLGALLASVAFFLLAWLGEPGARSIIASAYELAVAGLRGCGAALIAVSLMLDLRLRALRHRSALHSPTS